MSRLWLSKMEIQKLVPANTNRNSATPTSASAISKQYAHSAAVSKIGAKEMLRVYSQHSELLRKIKVLEPFALPDNYSYVDKSSSKLAENEKSLTKPLPLKSPPTYRWKEIRVISVTETNNSTFSSRTPRKSNDTSKIADDSGFSELVDSDYPLASSSTMKTNLGITKTAELKKTKQSSVSTTNQRASYPKKSSAKVQMFKSPVNEFIIIFLSIRKIP